jgi:hypothetical protein
VNVGDRGRQQYRVSPQDLDSFLKAREVQPPPERPRQNARQLQAQVQ